ncbi:MAG: lamin tail domain-containing protein, partial [Myxococcales bacterium]|nr:lamin tail domain-containing protein [Myxococcales bacterium]
DPITLRAPTGAAAVSTFAHPFNPGNGVSAERVAVDAPDRPESWVASACGATPGAADCSGATPAPVEAPWVVAGVVVSEIMANPIDESSGEYVELYNAGPAPVDLAGWRLGDDDASDPLVAWGGGGTVLAPGGYAVVLDPDDAGDTYAIPAGALRLTVADSAIANGLATNDPIALATPDGAGSRVVATFSFPFNPGNGRSVERVALTGGDVAASWAASTCARARGDANNDASPGAKNCADPAGAPTGGRAAGQPCPEGGADCASGLCAVNTVTGATSCAASCAGGASCPAGTACVASLDATWPSLCVVDASAPAAAPAVVINELVYDGPGSDTEVFVELRGAPGTVLDGLELVGVNGANGDAYGAVALSGVVGADGYFVVAHPGGSAALLAAADQLSAKVDFQNGPDSVVLRWQGEAVDAVGYGVFGAGTSFAGEGAAAADQGPGEGLSRLPDGRDTGSNAADFALAPPTPGAPNAAAAAPKVASRLLISEVVVSPTAAEMVEILNPGSAPVDLSDVYLADYHAYHLITTGGGAPSAADFRLRFPAGATIAPGGYVTVSLETDAHFLSEHGVYPDFDLAEGGPAPAMRGEHTGSASLSNAQEALTLFWWDGASDLVVDLDYVAWGGTVEGTDKTGVVVGSSAYRADTPLSDQRPVAAPGSASVTRCDVTEGAERRSGGNGLGGDDETSEDLDATFQLLAVASPGGPGDCAAACVPACGGAACGDDGCGGSCGSCGGEQVCDDGACVTPASSLGLAEVAGFAPPAGWAPVEELVLLRSAAEYQAHFGAAPPAGVSFAGRWAIFWSAGLRDLPFGVARVTEVVDNTTELFVFHELQVPGEGCEALDYGAPVTTLVTFPAPASGATALVPIFGEDEVDCEAVGRPEGADCDAEVACGAELICAGTTFGGGGICFPSWMHRRFDSGAARAIPDGDEGGVRSVIDVSGLASVAMDVIVWVEVVHPNPGQLTVTLLAPPSWEGEYNYADVLFDRGAGSGGGVSLHAPTFFYPGDEAVNGAWTLVVVDHAGGAVGTVRWGLELTSRWD